MVKRPNDHNSMILLMMIFLMGLAMIFIPVIQQRNEIEADDSIYDMIAEEIQRQRESGILVDAYDGIESIETVSSETPEMEGLDEDVAMTDDSVDEAEIDVAEEQNPEVTDSAEVMVEENQEQQEEGVPDASDDADPAPTAKPAQTKKPASEKAADPSLSNPDYVAWISIPGTVISYPVVRSDRSDYYLHHLITGQSSKLGCLFSLTTSDYEEPSKNIAIYGHHLSNSTAMFSTLMNYKKQSYWENHQTIQLKTIYGDRNYRIFAVLNHTVSDWDASTATFTSEKAFMRFVDRAMAKALYDTGITVSEDDHIITLITCDRSYGGVQGRLLVMGVEQ